MVYAKVRKYIKRGIRTAGAALKKRYFKGKGFSRPNLTRIARDVYSLKRMVNTEKKYIETTWSSSGVGITGGKIDPITTVAQGTNQGQRVGNSIKMVSFQGEFRIEQQSSASAKCYGEMYLVSYNQTPDTPGISDFFDADSAGNYTDRCFRNNNTFKDFRVISKKRFIVPERAISGNKTDCRVAMYGKMQLHQRFTSTTAASVSTNQLYLICVISDGTNAASSGQNISGTIRINYVDN